MKVIFKFQLLKKQYVKRRFCEVFMEISEI
jgi:hypothetical protein